MVYRRYKNQEEFAISLIFGVFIITVLLAGGYFADPYINEFSGSFEFFKLLIQFLPLAILILGFAFYRFSYKIIVTDGKVIETQLFRKTREVSFNEITAIEGGRFRSVGLYFPFPTYTIVDAMKRIIKKSHIFPQIKNSKHDNFPRYAVEGNLAQELRQDIPNLRVTEELLIQQEKKVKEEASRQIYLLILLIVVVGLIVYSIYSSGGFGSVIAR